jgi:hypothetical protein
LSVKARPGRETDDVDGAPPPVDKAEWSARLDLLLPYEHRTGLVRELWVVASPLALHSGHIGAALEPKEAS